MLRLHDGASEFYAMALVRLLVFIAKFFQMKYILAIFSVMLMGVSYAAAQLLSSERSTSIVTIDGESYYVHSVKKGETVYSLSRIYGVPEDKIMEINPHVREGLRDDHVLKIPFANTDVDRMSSRKQARLFDTHIVNPGETLYAVSRRYQIPVNTLIEDNEGLDPSHLYPGQSLNIRKKSVGDATPAQIEQQLEDYQNAINSVSGDYEYYLVKQGETLYTLSRRFGVTEQQLSDLNNLTNGLKAGALIKVRPKGIESGHFEAVADSLQNVDRMAEDSVMRSTVTLKDYSKVSTVDVAMFLPFGGVEVSAGKKFLEFYQGALLALEDLKHKGVSVNMSLYSTSRSVDEVRNIIWSQDFGDPDIIIGPVYEENMGPAVEYAQRNGIVMISPLGVVESTQSPVLYQMAPDPSNKYDKLKELFIPGRNVIYITTPNKDVEIENYVKPLLPHGYKHVEYTSAMRADKGALERALGNLVDPNGDNLFVISCTNEQVTDRILADISSYHWNLAARSQMSGNVSVLGGSGWSEFGKIIDNALFFKLNVCYLAFYHADRGSDVVKDFDRRFVSAYGNLPSVYAYRGYDAVKLFGEAVRLPGATFNDKLNSNGKTLLQMPYIFYQKEHGGTYYNGQWGLVCYGSDHTIKVK